MKRKKNMYEDEDDDPGRENARMLYGRVFGVRISDLIFDFCLLGATIIHCHVYALPLIR